MIEGTYRCRFVRQEDAVLGVESWLCCVRGVKEICVVGENWRKKRE